MKYVQVSENVLCDLLNCKSKVNDLKMLVDDWASQLKELNLLDEMTDILYAERYGNESKNGGKIEGEIEVKTVKDVMLDVKRDVMKC